ncbi:(2Fe-2S)-binding protein [Streptomyces sp. NBC_01381]|uniref:(2Fe-2S)-binding protein n=1 Tax=Streptomyces sp. NBC_01381 TaxID=2903845 RepID=UPI0022508872|nr:(2Fe-2S)-binding protein [Streptomyces sp. NBC_01381]MCX4666917.1 (2Fe-2S)-binding protein [Streptomyces sp. NBC_01381]
MSDDQDNNGGWQPHPQGEYDSDATAFVQLPEGLLDGSPLAAPGHGYVPPQITVTPTTADATDPAATGTWVMPADVTGAGTASGVQGGQGGQGVQNVQWPVAGEVPVEPSVPSAPSVPEQAYDHGATGQWSFHEAEAAAPAPADVTGQWSIPVANGDLPDESGEFTTSSLAAQWGGTPPATLPGGAAAPWATGGAGKGEPWSPEPEPLPEPQVAAEVEVEPQVAVEPAPAPAPVPVAEPEPVLEPEPEPVSAEVTDDAPVESLEAPAVPDAEAEAEAEAAPEDPPSTSADLGDEHPLCSYVLRVNGTDRPVTDAWIGESLLYVLRERLGLAGAKDGCSQGECGACNVQVDGRLVASCLVPAATAAGSEVRTVEGLAADGHPSDVQRALAACGAVQCGFCVPGMAMTLHDLLEGNPAPSDLETRRALCGNLCRCSGYRGVLDAVHEVVAEREASAAAAEPTSPDDPPDAPRIPHQAGPGAGGVNAAAYDGTYEGPGAYEGPGTYEGPYGQDGGQA